MTTIFNFFKEITLTVLLASIITAVLYAGYSYVQGKPLLTAAKNTPITSKPILLAEQLKNKLGGAA